MLRLSKLADYSVILLATLAQRNDPLMTAGRLSEITTLPAPTVAKLLKKLSKSGLVSAVRGAAGGYKLARPAQDISAAQIIEAVDGPIAITGCATHIKIPCAHISGCPIIGRWEPVNDAIREAFSAVSLAHLISAESAALSRAAAGF